jgi:hypothetical protein
VGDTSALEIECMRTFAAVTMVALGFLGCGGAGGTAPSAATPGTNWVRTLSIVGVTEGQQVACGSAPARQNIEWSLLPHAYHGELTVRSGWSVDGQALLGASGRGLEGSSGTSFTSLGLPCQAAGPRPLETRFLVTRLLDCPNGAALCDGEIEVAREVTPFRLVWVD